VTDAGLYLGQFIIIYVHARVPSVVNTHETFLEFSICLYVVSGVARDGGHEAAEGER
jgi:hypothetical protein